MIYPFSKLSDVKLLDSSQVERVRYASQLKDESRSDSAPHKCKDGKACNGRCIPQDHKCGGAEHNATMMAYHQIGGDDYAHELTQKNKNMDDEHAQMYMREVAKNYLVAGRDPVAFNKEIDRVNKKYSSHFGN